MASNVTLAPPKFDVGPLQGTQQTFRGDPAMIYAQSSVTQALAFAEAQALQQQQQLLINYGDPELTRSTLYGQQQQQPSQPGAGMYRSLSPESPWWDKMPQKVKDDWMAKNRPFNQVVPTDPWEVVATRKNPFSILANLGLQNEMETERMREALNQANLWYSGERQEQERLQGRQYAERRYQAGRSVAEELAAISAALQAARLEGQDRLAQAKLDAQLRAQQRVRSAYGG